MGLFSKVKRFLKGRRPVAEIHDPDFVESGTLVREGGDWFVEVEFSELVKQGNDVSHLNIGEVGKQIHSQKDLVVGDSGLSLTVGETPEEGKFRLIAVDESDSVYSESILEISKEPAE